MTPLPSATPRFSHCRAPALRFVVLVGMTLGLLCGTGATAPRSAVLQDEWILERKLEQVHSSVGAPVNFVWKPVTAVAWSPDGKFIATGGEDALVKVFRAKNGHCEQVLRGHRLTPDSRGGSIMALQWKPDGRILASAGVDGDLRLWQWPGGLTRRVMPVVSKPPEYVSTIDWSPDGQRLLVATGMSHQSVEVWDPDRGKVVRVLGSGQYARWDPSGRYVAMSGGMGQARILWAESGRVVHTLQERVPYRSKAEPYPVAWSPDGKRLAVPEEEITNVGVWWAGAGKQQLRLPGHIETVYGLRWSPDSKHLASLDRYCLRIWDAATGKERAAVRVGLTVPQLLKADPAVQDQQPYVLSLAWAPDSRRIAVGQSDGILAVWRLK